MAIMRPVTGSIANWALQPPANVPIERIILMAASRMIWKLLVGQCLGRRNSNRVSRVHTHRIDVFDRTDDDYVFVSVAKQFQFEFFPAENRFFDQNFMHPG